MTAAHEGWHVACADEMRRLQERSDIHFARISDAEYKAMKGYTTVTYTDINRYLINAEAIIAPETVRKCQESITLIDQVVGGYGYDLDLVVFKGVSKRHYDWPVGSVRTMRQYFSTSLEQGVAEKYFLETSKAGNEPLMLEIRVPKESKALYIGKNTHAQDGDELELLLGRGAIMRVVSESDQTKVLEVIGFERS